MKYVAKPLVRTADVSFPRATVGDLLRDALRVVGACVLLYLAFGVVADLLARWLPVAAERRLEALVGTVGETSASYRQTAQRAQEIVDRMVASADLRPLDYRVSIVEQPAANAMALPGGRIVLTTGLVDQAASENELAMVLGHELGHFEQRDHVRSLGRALLVGLVLHISAGEDTAAAVRPFVDVAENSYSREQESAADLVGLRLLVDHYGHAGGATDFFARVAARESAPLWSRYTATHPAPRSRVTQIEREIEARGYAVHFPVATLGGRAASSAGSLAELQQALSSSPADVALRRRLADALLEREQCDEAAVVLRALPTHSHDVEMLLEASVQLTDCDQHEAAIQLAVEASALEPGDRRSQLAVGKALSRAGHHEAARSAFERVVGQYPKDVSALTWLAHAQLRLGDVDTAARTLHLALAIDPEHEWALGSMVEIMDRRGRFDTALGYLERQKRASDRPEALCRVEVSLIYRRGDAERAVELGQRCVRATPLDARLRFNLALALAATGRDQLALIECRYALAHDDELAEAHRLAARLLADAGEHEKASDHARRAVELDRSLGEHDSVLTELIGGAADAAGQLPSR